MALRPKKDIASSTFVISKRTMGLSVTDGLHQDHSIHNISFGMGLTIHHIMEFYRLWLNIHDVQLSEEDSDTIVSNATSSGSYSATSAYKTQLVGAASSFSNQLFGGHGASKVQVLHMAHSTGPSMYNRLTSTSWLAYVSYIRGNRRR